MFDWTFDGYSRTGSFPTSWIGTIHEKRHGGNCPCLWRCYRYRYNGNAAIENVSTVMGPPFTLLSALSLTTCLLRAGYEPIVTCSPANNTLCESYGAAACFDYNSPACGADIRVRTDNKLRYVLDCVTDATTMKMCYGAIGSSGGSYIALEATTTSVKYTRRDIRADWFLADAIMGDGVHMKGAYGRPPSPEDRRFGKTLFSEAQNWLQNDIIKPHPLELRSGGLASLPNAIDDLKLGKVRARKVVMELLAN
ncbi:hypothetical protein ONS95_012529 [Cadophora gregata]|uniref:uncharacterized protein n=1 Tax=Cadophora gregata TaxID=51156 RepID=UPI0026DB9F53|nr:uncharacterized protein ONS95_012529 [Cadophora gregata]KAK0118225.1 hypothetical protein ONS95_012529 [Cadophora gregata]